MFFDTTEAVSELSSLKAKSAKEQETMMEMVNNLTEGKVAMATKVRFGTG